MILAPSTRTKLRIARALHFAVWGFRAALGKRGDKVECRRGGVNWSLDLQEGIDLSIYLFGRFERQTALALERLLSPGAVVLDLGANVGAHALPMAKKVGRPGKVYAIEPTSWAFSKLLDNIELNPDLAATLIPIQAAFTDASKEAPKSFYSSWDVTSDAGTHPVHGGKLHSLDSAEVLTLDEFITRQKLERLDVIKMDVDGFETRILKGATETLRRFKPKILFELCPHVLAEHGTSASELLGILESAGYRFFNEAGTRPAANSTAELVQLVPGGGSLNVLGVPS